MKSAEKKRDSGRQINVTKYKIEVFYVSHEESFHIFGRYFRFLHVILRQCVSKEIQIKMT